MTNSAFLKFALNWVYHVKALNISNFVVAALDTDSLAVLVAKDINTFLIETKDFVSGEAPWGSPAFYRLGRIRVCLIEALLSLRFDIIFSDVDIVFLRDPMDYFKLHPGVDVLASSDAMSYSTISDDLEIDPMSHSLNVGLLMLRPKALALAQIWKSRLEEDWSLWEQDLFNKIVHESSMVQWWWWRSSQVSSNDSLIQIGVLPVLYFCSGHTYFVERLPQNLRIKPYAIHATFQFSGTAGKELRFKESLLWNFSYEHFRHSVGFMTFKMHYELHDWTEGIQRHFELINYQLQQIRHGVALAQALNRVLIVPEILCGVDRYWAGHSGRIPESHLKLPFICPLDHIFNIEAWNSFAKTCHGVEFRESSFLNNTLLPKKFSIHEIQLEQDSTIERLARRFQNLNSSIVLSFNDLSHVRLFHEDLQKGEEFMKDMNRLTDLWCCFEDSNPGHVWYDAFWDVIPHVDKHNRTWETKWRPIPGP
eukprot:g6700.t1